MPSPDLVVLARGFMRGLGRREVPPRRESEGAVQPKGSGRGQDLPSHTTRSAGSSGRAAGWVLGKGPLFPLREGGAFRLGIGKGGGRGRSERKRSN